MTDQQLIEEVQKRITPRLSTDENAVRAFAHLGAAKDCLNRNRKQQTEKTKQ